MSPYSSMLVLVLAAHALLASASPLRQRRGLEGRQNCTLGALVCNGSTQWALCGPQGLQFQAVAVGTECSNGQIIVSGAGAGAGASSKAPAAQVAATSAAPVPVPSSNASPSSARSSTAAAASSSAPAATSSAPAPAAPSTVTDTTAAPASGYTMYKGDGSNWPAMSSWLSFDKLWDANTPTLLSSCTQFSQPNNSPKENDDMQAAIKATAGSTGVDPRMILAIIIQESRGCVRVWTTSYSVANPGIMQSHAGTGSCNSGISTGGAATGGKAESPCPAASIQQMVTDGVAGTSSGDGLKALGATGTEAKGYYTAARKYNSGSVAADGDLSSPQSVATKCYASDVANRLLGFTGSSSGKCTLDAA